MKKMFKNILCLTFLMAILTGQAQGGSGWGLTSYRSIQLNFWDQEYWNNVLYLKTALVAQYPYENPQNLELDSIVLVAKSNMGTGEASLYVNGQYVRSAKVPGEPEFYWNPEEWTFYNVNLNNIPQSSGSWNILLMGRVKVRRVILNVRDRGYPQPNRYPQPTPYPQPPTQNIECGSSRYRYTTCPVSGRIARATLVGQQSIAPCVFGQSWGYSQGSNYIWVNLGCRATFAVDYF